MAARAEVGLRTPEDSGGWAPEFLRYDHHSVIESKTDHAGAETRPIELVVAGKATTKQRQRFDPRSRRAYTPPSNIIGENDVRAIWREAGEPRIEDDTAISIEVVIVVPRPNSHFKANGDLTALGQRHPIPRNKKPDLDNALKLIMDALNSRAYKDDVQVARAVVERRWGEWPSTTIRLNELH